ncbi:MAG: DUF4065 domain-containing protein [Firmicutes bacterium]|nr:DUF4065 domain-containing protein [Bacillota bacterium]
MEKRKIAFCIECRKETAYHLQSTLCKKTVREKEFNFQLTEAVCNECGAQIGLHGLLDLNAKEIDHQYRKKENIVSVEEIEKLMDVYHIGKAPLSYALGFGEITITRYLAGQMPSKEYSDTIRRALESPRFMKEKLEENREKVGEAAYKKAVKAIKDLEPLMALSEKMLVTISYIFNKMEEITPLALQKMLYYIQGFYMMMFGKELFSEECEAWVHGPVYKNVYQVFKSFRYNPIDDVRFSLLQNRFVELNENEKRTIDLIINSFGMYSGRMLERITHNEKPWCDARTEWFEYQASNEIISKSSICNYFKELSELYDFTSVNGIREYIECMLSKEDVL